VPKPSHQTVTLRRGKHASPDRGACVIELASMLAGDRFSDHPPSVCPVIAGFLRGYNDLVPEDELAELYPVAARVVGSAGPRSVRRDRARRLLEWAREPGGRLRTRRPPGRGPAADRRAARDRRAPRDGRGGAGAQRRARGGHRGAVTRAGGGPLRRA
jgi:hypothetical protein